VTDGVTHHNLWYADSFSEFPLVSTQYGLPLTARDAVVVDLAALFPEAGVGTTLTLTVQAGNGGSGATSSLGYFDHFRLVAGARAVTRTGSGVNPLAYVAAPPVIGESWQATVDASVVPGTTSTVILGHEGAPAVPTIVPGGELLIDLTSPFVFQTSVLSSGGLDLHESSLPMEPSMVGRLVRTQAFLVGPNGVVLGNAVDLVVGLAPREKASAAQAAPPLLR